MPGATANNNVARAWTSNKESAMRMVGRIQFMFVLKDRSKRIVTTNVNSLFGVPVAAAPSTKKEPRATTAMANQAMNDAERTTVSLNDRRII